MKDFLGLDHNILEFERRFWLAGKSHVTTKEGFFRFGSQYLGD